MLAANPAGPAHLVSDALTPADLGLFQLIEGLRYAFPKTMARARPAGRTSSPCATPSAILPRIAAYLASPRRIPFNEDGIFRHYPELDG